MKKWVNNALKSQYLNDVVLLFNTGMQNYSVENFHYHQNVQSAFIALSNVLPCLKANEGLWLNFIAYKIGHVSFLLIFLFTELKLQNKSCIVPNSILQ